MASCHQLAAKKKCVASSGRRGWQNSWVLGVRDRVQGGAFSKLWGHVSGGEDKHHTRFCGGSVSRSVPSFPSPQIVSLPLTASPSIL